MGKQGQNVSGGVGQAMAQSKVGDWCTAHTMACTPHSLSRDGQTAHTVSQGQWGWSDHFKVWARVA